MKFVKILKEALPVIIMIVLIPFIVNDYILATIYLLGGIVLLSIRRQKHDVTVFIFGLIALTVSEAFS